LLGAESGRRWAFFGQPKRGVMSCGALLACMLALARADDIPNLKDPDMITAGSQLFQEKQCAYCHGQGGSGAIRLAGRSDLEAAYIFETIAEGRVKGALRMPSWRGVLTDDQIWQATAYIMSLSKP
jgi:mono/diheme cytochrome c family protein